MAVKRILATPDYNDPHGPQPGSISELDCIHCERFIWGSELSWRPDSEVGGLWGCKHAECDGAGIAIDLWSVVEHPEIDKLPRNNGERSPMYPEKKTG